MEKYLFTSKRLGFRNWTKKDIVEFAKMNADDEVMKHFPVTLNENESLSLITRLQNHYKKYGYSYFVCEVIETGEFIGFIGFMYLEFKAFFNPAIDIGWRLKKSSWGKGYATEGAKRCLQYAFNDLNIQKIISICTLQNTRSENVMKKIGMQKEIVFNHPKLKAYPSHEKCVLYILTKNNFSKQQT